MIPRTLHMLWMGPRPMPTEWRDRWLEMHPDWVHVLWDEAAIRGLPLVNAAAFDWFVARHNWAGAADVARIEILHAHGGVWTDIDSEPLRPLDRGPFMRAGFFAGLANPMPSRPGRIANGTMGSIAGHPVLTWAIAEIGRLPRLVPAWDRVGGTLITRAVAAVGDDTVRIMPPGTFYPEDSRGRPAAGPKTTAYARHFWASTPHSARSYR